MTFGKMARTELSTLNRTTRSRKFAATLAATLALASCATPVSITSEPPGARVRLVGEGNKPGAPLGTTPLFLKSFPGDDSSLIEVEKEGHLPRQVLIPRVPGASVAVTTRLQPLTREYLAQKNKRDFASALNANLAEILKLQQLVLGRKGVEVVALAKTMEGDWGEVSLFHSLMGNHHYLSGNFTEARKRYEKALALDPNNAEARTMLAGMR
jgi:hypothetical protein